jgi:serine/threonine protein kinase
MGKVYLALHPGIGREAAVKVLASTEAADPNIVGRFVNEARAANAIRHPNIVDIYDCGVLEGGVPYIVMEYLDGEPLTNALARGPIPLDDVLDWSCQVAEALAAAHAHDVVHRDLKPDNLFLVPDPRRKGKKQVKVLDFGIAKLQRQTLGPVHKTRTGALLGTPLYMSPEQCMSVKGIDLRTDVYSFGVILYEMATGRRPFDGDGVYAVISMHINEPPIPPRTHRPSLPTAIEAIILQALSKAPSQRQESMAVVLSQLELARGNAEASSEALVRQWASPVQEIPLPPSKRPTLAEIRTLGDTALSKPVTGQITAVARRSRKPWLPLVAVLGGAIAVLYLWTPTTHKPPSPAAQPPALAIPPTPIAPIAPPVPLKPTPPAAPARPSTVEIGLDSDPAGAAVFLGDVLVGITPTHFKATAGTESIEFEFRKQGFAPERVRALPADGLTVRARFSAPQPASHPVVNKKKRAKVSHTESSGDIQTER